MRLIVAHIENPQPRRVYHRLAFLWLLGAFLFFCGCASGNKKVRPDRGFNFDTDKFAFANELVWEYEFKPDGTRITRKRVPPPEYTHHCYVVALAARKFFYHAHFYPFEPAPNKVEAAKLVKMVLDNPESVISRQKAPIGGYPNLFEFSRVHGDVIKEAAGGAWRSYVQRGHWRIVFPFSRSHQEETAEQLISKLNENLLPIVHLTHFPSLNHAVLIFQAEATDKEIIFKYYDPNDPSKPWELRFDRKKREFLMHPTPYFRGGKIDVYEVYKSLIY